MKLCTKTDLTLLTHPIIRKAHRLSSSPFPLFIWHAASQCRDREASAARRARGGGRRWVRLLLCTSRARNTCRLAERTNKETKKTNEPPDPPGSRFQFRQKGRPSPTSLPACAAHATAAPACQLTRTALLSARQPLAARSPCTLVQ